MGIEIVTEKAQQIFEIAGKIIESLGDNEKTNVSKLTEDVAKVIGCKPNDITHIIVFFTKNYNKIFITPGRYGGIYKGIPRSSSGKHKVAEKAPHSDEEMADSSKGDI